MTGFYETCAMCGPRNIKSEDIATLLIRLDRELGLLASQNVSCFRAVPSPGFNFYAALSVLNLKRNFPELELEVLVGNFNNNLSREDIEVRDFIISHADIVKEVRVAVREIAADALSSALTKDSSYLLTFSETDAGFCTHVREHAALGGQQIIYTDRINTGVSV
ncbi:MAG: hypothetical protein IJ391_04825 [Clostridia bacterium]|nr:hypothetical protein [Clostridia bacterium]